ncbi:Carbohydrate sulfotransferase 1 [Lamellibrachia satsuma]|nr:Carbohydrate sulfotransferase 1 [Lamellibrachia satsuma]
MPCTTWPYPATPTHHKGVIDLKVLHCFIEEVNYPMRMYKRKTDQGRADHEQIMTAVRKVVDTGLPCRNVADEHGIPHCTLRRYCISKRSLTCKHLLRMTRACQPPLQRRKTNDDYAISRKCMETKNPAPVMEQINACITRKTSMSIHRLVFLGLSIVGVIGIVYHISTLQLTTLHLPLDEAVVLANHIHAAPAHSNNKITAKHIRRYGSNVSTTRPKVQGSGNKILVLTKYRSGSTFIGQLLNEHPDIACLFEPLRLMSNSLNTYARISVASIDSYMKKLFSCAFTDALHDVQKLLPQRFISSFACETFTRHLNKRPRICSIDDLERVQLACKQARYVAIKVICIYPEQLVLIKKFLQEEMQIVHLLRDPRGVFSSRITIVQYKSKQQRSAYIRENFDVLVGKASNHCKSVRDTLVMLASWKAADPSFNDFYHLVRYEDFAYHPEDMARTLYSSLGISLHKNVKATTEGNKAVGHDFYSTSRDSTETAEAWRNKLPFYFVRAMQELPHCQYIKAASNT